VKRRQATLLTRKSLPGSGKRKGGHDDSEDEFKPTKASAKTKKPVGPGSARDKSVTVVPSKSTVDIDDDDDDVPPPPPRKRVPVKKMKDESESDFEIVGKPAVKEVTKAKVIQANTDSEVEVVPGLLAKGKGKTKEVLKRKR
jgi:DNA topoisomerase-2